MRTFTRIAATTAAVAVALSVGTGTASAVTSTGDVVTVDATPSADYNKIDIKLTPQPGIGGYRCFVWVYDPNNEGEGEYNNGAGKDPAAVDSYTARAIGPKTPGPKFKVDFDCFNVRNGDQTQRGSVTVDLTKPRKPLFFGSS